MMQELYSTLKSLELGKAYNYVMENNPSSGLPYHNSFHIEHVCLFAMKGAEFYKIPNQNKKLLATAALFHDFDHSGSGKNDDENILRAVKGFIEYNSTDDYFTEEEVRLITSLIKATRYPYIQECVDLTNMEKILRDSDVLQGLFCQNYINGVVFAIAKEANIPYKSMLDGQVSFIKSTNFCTDWATDKAKEVIPEIIEKVNTVKEMFKN